jgi:parvulin-like peptidyl-prolyl isomerase
MYMTNRNHFAKRILGPFLIALILISAPFAINAFGEGLSMMKPSHATRDALVIVNTDTVYTTDLDTALIKFHSGADQKILEQFDYHKLLNKLVNDRLIVQEARSIGVDQEEWLTTQMQKIRRDFAVRRYIADTFKPDTETPDNDVAAYFKENYYKVQIRMLSVRTLDEANNLIAAIKEGASMDSIARDVSLDTYKFQGGLHPVRYRRAVEGYLQEHLTNLKQGQLSAPFRNQQAYSFIRLEQSLPADNAELPELKEFIIKTLKNKRTEDAWKIFVRDLQKKFPMVTDSALLRNIQTDSAKLYTQDFVKGSDAPLFSIDNSNKITDEEFRKILSKAAMGGKGQSFETIFSGSMDRIKEQMVLTAAANRAGYENDSQVEAACEKSLDSTLIEAYLKETIVSQITFSHAELEEYYRENQEKYRESEQLLFDHMTIKDSARAQEIAGRLADGADFDYLARQYGDEIKFVVADNSRDWKPLGVFPSPIAEEMQKLEIGRVSRPYLTSEGWMIFRVKGRREGKIKPMADVEMDIKGVLFQRKFDALLDDAIAKLKANSNIEYKDKAIDSYFGK